MAATSTLSVLWFVALAVLAGATSPEPASAPWELRYATWRRAGETSLASWWRQHPTPVPKRYNSSEAWAAAPGARLHDEFRECLSQQAANFTRRVLRYRPPPLADVRDAVRIELDRRGAVVTVVVFWGRARYVSLLWMYLQRALRLKCVGVRVCASLLCLHG